MRSTGLKASSNQPRKLYQGLHWGPSLRPLRVPNGLVQVPGIAGPAPACCLALRDDSASLAECSASVHSSFPAQSTIRQSQTQLLTSQFEELVHADPNLHGAPMLAGSLMAMAGAGHLVQQVASRLFSPLHQRGGMLLEMAGIGRSGPHGSTPTNRTTSINNRQQALSSRGATSALERPQNKDAELTAALQVAEELEAQVQQLAADVKEREDQLNGMHVGKGRVYRARVMSSDES